LLRYYELGKRASDTAPDGRARTPGSPKDLAAEAGFKTADPIRKALIFAITYSKSGLEKLLALRSPVREPLSAGEGDPPGVNCDHPTQG
jgi:hypothetical protein